MGLFKKRKTPGESGSEGEAQPPKPANPPSGESAPASPTGADVGGASPTEPAKPAGTGPAKPGGAVPEFLEATDTFGRRVRLTRDEYKKRVLPDLIKAHGNDPAQLTAVIMQALQQGFARELIQAANRLVVIDKEPERALSVLSVVQRDAGDLEAAEFSLDELQQKHPDSIGARVGKAMLAQKRGDLARCEELLWEALQLDPNNGDAVHGWLQARHQQTGEAGHPAELEKLVAQGSWRARLWRARLDLQQDRVDAAAATYRELLEHEQAAADALLMAAADLVNHKQHALIDELVAGRFEAGRDHPNIGLALLQHYLLTHKHVPGAELLHLMYLHYGHVVPGPLQPYTAEFDRMRLEQLPPLAAPAQPKVGMYRLEWPSFCAALADPQWLLPSKADGHKQVLFVALSLEGQPDPATPAGQQEDYGRLTRAIPMFLAEHVWLATPHRGTVALPMTEPGGWAVMGQPWPEEQIAAQLGDAERNQSILVTGVLRLEGETRRVDLWAYDPKQRQRIGHAAAEGSAQDLGRMLLQLMAELWPLLDGPAESKPPVGSDESWQRYAEGLGQHAALVVTRAGAMPKDRLYGERYIAQWLQTAALQEPRWQPGFWTYASALCLLDQLGSPIAKEHARVLAEVFRQSPPDSPFARLAVLPLRAAGLEQAWQARRAEIVAAAGGNPAYLQWLERAEASK